MSFPFQFTVNLRISPIPIVLASLSCFFDGSNRQRAKPPTVPMRVNTKNGRIADISVNEPMNEADKRHIRPQIVHDSISDFLYFGATSSAVLDSSSTSVIDVNILISRANVKTNTGFVLFETRRENNYFTLSMIIRGNSHSSRKYERNSTETPPNMFSRPVRSHFRLESKMNTIPNKMPMISEHPEWDKIPRSVNPIPPRKYAPTGHCHIPADRVVAEGACIQQQTIQISYEYCPRHMNANHIPASFSIAPQPKPQPLFAATPVSGLSRLPQFQVQVIA